MSKSGCVGPQVNEYVRAEYALQSRSNLAPSVDAAVEELLAFG